MEVDLGDMDEMQAMEEGDVRKKCYLEGMTEEEKAQLNDLLHEQYDMSIMELKDLSPMYLINKMTTDALGCSDFKMMEVELLKIALMHEKTTGGLETAKKQLAIADQVFDGRELLLQLTSATDFKDIFPSIVAAYKSGKLSVLADLVNDERLMSKKAFKILVVDRNKRWAKVIPKIMEQNSAFIAVGAGHLPGEKGVIHLLQKQGYSVNPVYR